MSDNGYVSRKELDAGLVRTYGETTAKSGRKWKYQTLSEGELSKAEAFIAQWEPLEGAARDVALKKVNEEGRARAFQAALVNPDGSRMFGDGSAECEAAGRLVPGEDAQELFEAVRSHIGLGSPVNIDTEELVKNLLRDLVAGSQ